MAFAAQFEANAGFGTLTCAELNPVDQADTRRHSLARDLERPTTSYWQPSPFFKHRSTRIGVGGRLGTDS
jgi:hypothetical protein